MYLLPEETLLLPWVSCKDSWKQTNDQQIYLFNSAKMAKNKCTKITTK